MSDIALRLGCALVAGIVLGLEREKRGRAAGLRTTAVVCVAAALAMVLSEELPMAHQHGALFGGDPGRLAAGVLTGMGFLGAGVIIRQDTLVRGVTTAAVLWLTTIIGLLFGSGHLMLGAVGVGMALAILVGLPFIERQMDNDGYIPLTITMTGAGESMTDLEALFRRHRFTPLTTSVRRLPDQIVVTVHGSAPKRDSLDLPAAVTAELRALPTVQVADWSG
jgi:uncharacterized membrane protein YhiD involved in acid resistance